MDNPFYDISAEAMGTLLAMTDHEVLPTDIYDDKLLDEDTYNDGQERIFISIKDDSAYDCMSEAEKKQHLFVLWSNAVIRGEDPSEYVALLHEDC